MPEGCTHDLVQTQLLSNPLGQRILAYYRLLLDPPERILQFALNCAIGVLIQHPTLNRPNYPLILVLILLLAQKILQPPDLLLVLHKHLVTLILELVINNTLHQVPSAVLLCLVNSRLPRNQHHLQLIVLQHHRRYFLEMCDLSEHELSRQLLPTLPPTPMVLLHSLPIQHNPEQRKTIKYEVAQKH